MQEFNIGDKVLVEMKVVGKYHLYEPSYKVEIDESLCGVNTWMDGKNIYPADIAARAREDGMTEAWELAKIGEAE